MFGKADKTADLEFFTVYDSKSKSYSEPFPAINTEVVLRDFHNAFKHPEASTKNRYFMNAEDYSIFRIGTFDQKTGSISSKNPEHVVNLHDLRSMATASQGQVGILPT